MKRAFPAITPTERKFIIVWCILMSIIFISLSYFGTTLISSYRAQAITRHHDRINPLAIKPGDEAALPKGANPRKVKVGIYLDGISAVSILESHWDPVFYIWFKWRGDDIHPGESFSLMDGELKSKEKLAEFDNKGEKYAIYFVRAEITKYFTTDRFPLDSHVLTIQIEDGDATWSDLEYEADVENSSSGPRVHIPGYKVTDNKIIVKPHTYHSNFGDPRIEQKYVTYSQTIFALENERIGIGPYLKTFVGLFAAMSIALLALLIKPTDVDPRFGLGVGGFFGAVTNTFIGASMVTDTGVMTLMDLVNGFGMLTIFLTLVQSTTSLYLYDLRGKVEVSKVFDRVSFVIFTIGSLAFNILIPWFAIT